MLQQRVRRCFNILWGMLCIILMFSSSEHVMAATSQEANSEDYGWYTDFKDGTGEHYILNLPITDWKSSAPHGSTMGGKLGVDYIRQEGSFINNPVTWKWSDINKLTMTNSNVWKTKYVNGKPYDITYYGDGGYCLSFYKYEGTFYIDPSYNMNGMNFVILPVSESPYCYIDDDVYFFLYPLCLKNQINDSNFMDYFVFWIGTQTIWDKSKYFHGVQGTYLYNSSTGEPFQESSWWSFAEAANASKTVSYGYSQVKNRSDYDGRWGITMVCAGNAATSSTYRYLVGAEFKQTQILYDGNGASSGANYTQTKGYGKSISILENRFARDGYIFTGWNTKKDGSGTTYQPAQVYSENKPMRLFAQWKRASYTITYHGNGSTGGEMANQVCHVNQSHLLNPNGFIKTGYTFEGWAINPDGETKYQDCASIYNLSTTNGAVIHLYAKWKAIAYTVHFDGNGATHGSMADMVLTYDQITNLPANEFSKETEYGLSTFVGWNVTGDTLDALYENQEAIVNLATEDGSTVTLYAIWDDCPWIVANDLYYTLEQAQSGFVTQDELMSHATASDREDGSPIMPGYDELKGTRFWIPDYQENDFLQFMHDGSVSETYRVVDHSGNIYEKCIMVYIVDTTAEPVRLEGTTRFIDEKYYNTSYEQGGLGENSIWNVEPEYRDALHNIFLNIKQQTPKYQYQFSTETISLMKEFVEQNGMDDRRTFFDRFLAMN